MIDRLFGRRDGESNVLEGICCKGLIDVLIAVKGYEVEKGRWCVFGTLFQCRCFRALREQRYFCAVRPGTEVG